MASKYLKDPTETEDYSIDWTTRLGTGETITTSTYTVPAGLTKNSDTHSGAFTTVWLSGGTVDTEYTVSNSIVTSGGRTYKRSFTVKIVNL